MHTSLVPEPIKLTYQDFCALPDDGRRYEILDGDLYMSPSPGPQHQRIAGRIYAILDAHVRKAGLGEAFPAPLDVLLEEHEIVEPDVVFVSRARASIITEANIRGVPDLLVEILSPSTKSRDIRDKRNIYARCGVPWYWIVDPEARTLLELQLVGGAYAPVALHESGATFRPGLFPELAIDLNGLWD
jgi:Uma2 family endonuclease